MRISDWSSDVCSSDLEQGTDELAVPREFGDDLDADAMLGLRAAEELLAIEPVATREMREEIFLQRGEMRRRHRHIGLAPPDSVGGLRILDDELVLGAAAGVLAGGDDEWTVLGQQSFAVTDRFLDQPRRTPVFSHIRLRLDRK